ncbi:MAG: hypothetical protein HZA01_07330 [Nitrospinae bacterium]|nr:hypothetical protein [Nitrospinota bacterium]
MKIKPIQLPLFLLMSDTPNSLFDGLFKEFFTGYKYNAFLGSNERTARAAEEINSAAKRSQELQYDAVKALERLHNNQPTVSLEDFLRTQGESLSVLHNLAGGLGELYREQRNTTDALDILGQVSQQGFMQMHKDLSGIGEEVRDAGQAVRDGFDQIQGPRPPKLSIRAYAESPTGLLGALSAYAKGVLSSDADRDLLEMINDRLGSRSKRDSIMESLAGYLQQKGLSGDEWQKEYFKIHNAVDLIQYPGWLVEDDHANALERLSALSGYAAKHDIPALNSFLKKAHGLLALKSKSRQTPLAENQLIKYSNDGLLTSGMQHHVKKHHREAREGGTLVDLNYNLLETLRQGDTAIRQRDAANYHLSNIVENLADTNEHLVNLEGLVENFSEVVSQGFNSVVETLETGFSQVAYGLARIAEETALARAELASELRHIEQTAVNIGTGIERKIQQTNTLLEELVWLGRQSHTNEARQHFSDALACLERADTQSDVEDAYNAFDDGAGKVRSSAENHYGAALCAELLGNLEEAGLRYGKAARRAGSGQKELASWAHEGMARIGDRENNLPLALASADQAVAADPENLTARFSKARYLALLGSPDEALNALAELIQKDEKYLLRFRLDPAFGGLPLDGLHVLYLRLWEESVVREPALLYHLLTEFLALKDPDHALAVFHRLASFAPMELLRRRVWEHPLFNRIEKQAKKSFQDILRSDTINLTAQPRYAMTFLLHGLGLPAEELLRAFVAELEGDPAWYDADKKKAGQKVLADLEKIGGAASKELIQKLDSVAPPEIKRLFY